MSEPIRTKEVVPLQEGFVPQPQAVTSQKVVEVVTERGYVPQSAPVQVPVKRPEPKN